jgi:hypothetical protein
MQHCCSAYNRHTALSRVCQSTTTLQHAVDFGTTHRSNTYMRRKHAHGRKHPWTSHSTSPAKPDTTTTAQLLASTASICHYSLLSPFMLLPCHPTTHVPMRFSLGPSLLALHHCFNRGRAAQSLPGHCTRLPIHHTPPTSKR